MTEDRGVWTSFYIAAGLCLFGGVLGKYTAQLGEIEAHPQEREDTEFKTYMAANGFGERNFGEAIN